MLIYGQSGSGKTTFSGKLADYLKRKKQKKIAGVNANRYRKKNIGVSSLLDNERNNKKET